MAVNHYFQQGKGIGSSEEQRLYEDIIIEGLKIYGQDIYYLPRSIVNKDLILGEDMLSRFRTAHIIEMYMETTEGFAGEQEIVNKFGLEIREDTTFMVSKRRFDEAVDSKTSLIKVWTESTASCHLLLATTKVVSSLISKPNLLMISCSPAKPSVVSIYISSKYESSNLEAVSSPKIKSLLTNVRGR